MNKLNSINRGFKHYQMQSGMFSPRIPAESRFAMDPGIYGIKADQEGNIYFIPQSAITDNLIRMPNTTSARIIEEVRHFWNASTRSKFDKYGMIYKRGILLHGKQGTGKTCTIVQVMEDLVASGGIVIFNPEPNLLFHGVNRMREIQPDMKVMVVFEEFEGLCRNTDFKSLLDGELQIDNIIYLATTNYIEQVPATFKNRPSRFATVIELGPPSTAERRIYLEAKLHADDKANLEEWVETSSGMVIDQIKDCIISVCCYGLTLQQAASKIEKIDFSGTTVASEDDEEYEQDDSKVETIKINIGKMLSSAFEIKGAKQ